MPFAIRTSLTPQAEAILRGMQALPGRIVTAIARGMDNANQLAVANIRAKHLTGEKGRGQAYPPEDHRLVTRTGRLRNSVWASNAQEVGAGNVQSAIGSNVIYAAIHEFGGTIHHDARESKVRLRTDAKGNRLRQSSNPNLFVFAKNKHARAETVRTQVPAYDVETPERAPFRTGIEESREIYRQEISGQIVGEWERMRSA